MPKLSPTQQSLLTAMQAAPDRRLIRYDVGVGYWHVEGAIFTPNEDGTMRPCPYWGWATVRSLAKKGFLKQPVQPRQGDWGDYVLASEKLVVAKESES